MSSATVTQRKTIEMPVGQTRLTADDDHDYGCFSLHAHRNIDTLGESGLLTTRTAEHAVPGRKLRWMENWPCEEERDRYSVPAISNVAELPEARSRDELIQRASGLAAHPHSTVEGVPCRPSGHTAEIEE